MAERQRRTPPPVDLDQVRDVARLVIDEGVEHEEAVRRSVPDERGQLGLLPREGR